LSRAGRRPSIQESFDGRGAHPGVPFSWATRGEGTDMGDTARSFVSKTGYGDPGTAADKERIAESVRKLWAREERP